jgi:pimeloyl-ACP methyl ester carboxylesterase
MRSKLVACASLVLLSGCTGLQRKYLFYPTHDNDSQGLSAWTNNGKVIGYSRTVANPENVWLMLHGNGGQASHRKYAIHCFSERDSVFIMEYPGYGAREGKPSRATIDAAAADAYLLLRKSFPVIPVCVVGESLGTGPACVLAGQSPPPDKIVLVVPFDKLTSVASDEVPWLPVGLILEAKWDNVRALSTYKGPVEIFGARDDTVIELKHAEKLAHSLPAATFHVIDGGHNEWSKGDRVEIRNP